MDKKVIIIGAGGHSKVVADIVKLNGDEILGFLDDNKVGSFYGYEIIGTTQDIGKWDHYYFPAIGNNACRERIMAKDVKWYTAIHPAAVISKDVVIGAGTIIAANSVVNPGSRIGKGVIVNTAATVDHDNEVNDFVHISPGAHLAGTVVVGRRAWIGIGANLLNNIEICSDVVVGAGAVVLDSLSEKGTYVGIPARLIR